MGQSPYDPSARKSGRPPNRPHPRLTPSVIDARFPKTHQNHGTILLGAVEDPEPHERRERGARVLVHPVAVTRGDKLKKKRGVDKTEKGDARSRRNFQRDPLIGTLRAHSATLLLHQPRFSSPRVGRKVFITPLPHPA